MPILKTFVQISDLHLGHIDPSKLVPLFSSHAPNVWAFFNRFQGLLGHHYPALQQLAAFMKSLKRETPQLIVTGDLTSCGHPDQFNTARDYLGAQLQMPKGRDGLGVLNWPQWTISGNHDQWPGTNRIFGPANAALGQAVPAMPSVQDVPLPDGRALQFIRLDTDADVRPFGWARFMAQGEFTTQLAAAAAMLPPPSEGLIRVLLLHHSRRFGTPGWNHPLVMKPNSRSALDDFLIDNDVQVMMCGHTHIASVRPHIATRSGKRQAVLETCCGTTTQRETIPATWKNLLGRRPPTTLTTNTLIVHQLVEEAGQLSWRARKYWRSNRRFVLMPNQAKPMVLV